MIKHFSKQISIDDGRGPQSAPWKCLSTVVPWGMEGPIWSGANFAKIDEFFASMSNNKQRNFTHLTIGNYRSCKMECTVDYQSYGEFYFFLALELNKAAVRYYPQLVTVPVFDNGDRLCSSDQTPAVLVLMDGCRPMLFQVKGFTPSSKDELIFKACKAYATKECFYFYSIQPRHLPKIVHLNVEFISSFLGSLENQQIVSKIMSFLRVSGVSRISDVATLAVPGLSQPEALHYIYHSIALGDIATDLLNPIDNSVYVHLPESSEKNIYDYIMEVLPV